VALSPETVRVLARCNGFQVQAGGEIVGSVETPVFSGTALLPDYLIVRTRESIPGGFRLVPPDLVENVDAAGRVVTLDLTVQALADLDEPGPRLFDRRRSSASKPC